MFQYQAQFWFPISPKMGVNLKPPLINIKFHIQIPGFPC